MCRAKETPTSQPLPLVGHAVGSIFSTQLLCTRVSRAGKSGALLLVFCCMLCYAMLCYLHPLRTDHLQRLRKNLNFFAQIPAKLFPSAVGASYRFHCEGILTFRWKHRYLRAVLSCNQRWGYSERRVSGLLLFCCSLASEPSFALVVLFLHRSCWWTARTHTTWRPPDCVRHAFLRLFRFPRLAATPKFSPISQRVVYYVAPAHFIKLITRSVYGLSVTLCV